MEIWKSIVNYEGFYEVSNTGKIKSLERYVKGRWSTLTKISEKILKPVLGNDGYYRVNLYKKGMKTTRVSRTVATAFVLNPENKPYVNHKDGNKLNNNDWNLEWSTASENTQHSFDNGLQIAHGEHNSQAKLTEKDVPIIRKLYETGLYYHKEIAEIYNVCSATIGHIIRGKTWAHVV